MIANGRWYVGLDITAFEENDWDPSTNLQLGIVFPFPSASRWYRFGVEFYDGRAHLDSFLMHRERYLIFGAWLDL